VSRSLGQRRPRAFSETVYAWEYPWMGDLPRGTVTLLFTDVDHSTDLVKRLQERYAEALARHRELLRIAFAAHGGAEVDTQGDAFFVAFGHTRGAVEAAVAAQRSLAEETWPEGARFSVRIGLHTGEPYPSEHGYTGVAVHRAARICTIAHGGQVLLSRATAGIVDDQEISGVGLRDLGEHRLKDFERPERIFQLIVDGLPDSFPPPRAIAQQTPLTGTVTVVMAEGRRMLRLMHELTSEQFGTVLARYQHLVPTVLEEKGGQELDVAADTVSAAFASPKQAAAAAAAAHRAMAEHEWPYGLKPEISVGLHSGEAGVGWVGRAVVRCAELCDAAEGGQTFLSPVTAGLLEGEDLGEWSLHDRGEVRMRRNGEPVRAYELVASIVPPAKD
jgi:class 3 adenylate cyclase